MTSDHRLINDNLTAFPLHRELADLLVDYLAQMSVDFVFGIPGGAIEPLYNALARSARKGGPRAVVARHETGAAFMADGYHRQTGKLAVCCGTTGPGTTNLITGVASAYENHIPILVITGQTALSHFGRGALQESSCTGINTVAMFENCSRYSTLISHVNQFEHKLATAIITAFGSPRGPAHLSIPLDILRSPSPCDAPSYVVSSLVSHASLVDGRAVSELCQQVERAAKVAFLVGDGCAQAVDALLELSLLIDAAVVATPHGKGLINPYHPLFHGILGFAGHASAKAALVDPQVDLIVACGTNLGEWASNGWDREALLNNRLIHVDSVEAHLAHSPMAKLHVRGEMQAIFRCLLRHIQFVRPPSAQSAPLRVSAPDRASGGDGPPPRIALDEPSKCASDAIPIKPQRLMLELSRLFPATALFLADAGNSQAWAVHYLHPPGPAASGKAALEGGRFRACSEFVSMGWAVGAAIGAALGSPGRPVVCITGDGSLLMSGQEITVAVQERLPVVFVVLNDSALGMVKHGQRLAGSEPIAFELPDIDYRAYARAMGAEGHLIRSPQDLLGLDIDAICRRAGPTLLDVRIDPEEVPPIGARMKVLGDPR
jgi:acetolactate synthase-1/2/3 large subunit